jgi:hypothetical protein
MMDRYYFPTSMFTQYPQVQSLYYYPILGNTNQDRQQTLIQQPNNINLTNNRNGLTNNVHQIFPNNRADTNINNANGNRMAENTPGRRNAITAATEINTQITDMLREAIQNQFTDNFDDEERHSRMTLQQITNTTSLDLAANTMTPADSSTCAICHGDFNPQQIVRRINFCRHVFHQNCIDTWLGDHNTCPVCRYDLSARGGNRDPIADITTETNDRGRRIMINRTIRRRTIGFNPEANRRRYHDEDDDSETTTSDDDEDEEQSESDDEDHSTHTHHIQAEIQIIREN